MHIVTGAFGYIGQYITRLLLERGQQVATITTHPDKPNPFGPAVRAFPYHFNNPDQLTRTLTGAETLFNTYWIRFPYPRAGAGQTYEAALANTRTLFRCARAAGVRRIVHISVTHAALDSPLPYYRGKAKQEEMLSECGVPYAILRPTLVFGAEDILVNNIAWLIRKFPLFPIFGSGDYRVQPVFVGDLAALAVEHASGHAGSITDATGPETFTFKQMVQLIAQTLQRNPLFIPAPPVLGILAGQILGLFLRDVLLTDNELRGLMQEYLTSPHPATAPTRFTDWLAQNKTTLGQRYTSELARHYYE